MVEVSVEFGDVLVGQFLNLFLGVLSILFRNTALFGFLLNGPYYLAARTGRWLRAQAFLRMCVDILLITLGLYSAGGLAAAPFIGVYAIIPVYAGIAFSRRLSPGATLTRTILLG